MITQSKLKSGSLLLGTAPGVEFACQATNVRITPTYEESGDPLETLCGDTAPADVTRGNTLSINAVQDFEDAAGFVNWTWTNDLDTVPFVWKPQGAAGPSYAGNVEVRAVEVGGDVNARLSTEAEWTCVGPVARSEAV